MNNATNQVKKFNVGESYWDEYPNGTQLRVKIVRRTAKTVWFVREGDAAPSKRRVREFRGGEFFNINSSLIAIA